MVTLVLLRVLVVILLVAANAFFVAAEFALVSVRDTRIQQLVQANRIGARTVQKLHQRLDELLAAVQLGVTIASLGLGYLGEATVVRLVEGPLGTVPHARIYAHAIAIPVSFIIITFFHVVLGEIVPKSLALQRVERVALSVSGPMDFFMTVFRPFLYVTSGAARNVLRLLGAKQMREAGVHSPEELKLIATASRRVGLMPAFQEEMIHSAIDLADLTVREIMVPRTEIFSLPSDLPLEQALARAVEEQHSRVPIYDPELGRDHILGVLYAKDLLRWLLVRELQSSTEPSIVRSMLTNVGQIMREVLVVPETKPVTDLLLEFKQRKRHMAVVVDEYGSIAGLVTVEDILEQIVGEIEDEYDIAAEVPVELGTVAVFDGSTSVRDLETQYRLVLPRDEGFETLAGFVFYRLQKIPQPGDFLEFEGRRFSVLEMEARRITKVKVESLQAAAGKSSGNREALEN